MGVGMLMDTVPISNISAATVLTSAKFAICSTVYFLGAAVGKSIRSRSTGAIGFASVATWFGSIATRHCIDFLDLYFLLR